MIYLLLLSKCRQCIDLDVFVMVKKYIFMVFFFFSMIFFCLDIIFFIYLYQRYIYPVDRKRLNEFGTTGETDSALVPAEDQPTSNEQQNPIDTTTEQHEKTE